MFSPAKLQLNEQKEAPHLAFLPITNQNAGMTVEMIFPIYIHSQVLV